MHYILWRVDYLTLRLMLVDQPRYVSADEQKRDAGLAPGAQFPAADDGSDIAAAFEAEQQRLGY